MGKLLSKVGCAAIIEHKHERGPQLEGWCPNPNFCIVVGGEQSGFWQFKGFIFACPLLSVPTATQS